LVDLTRGPTSATQINAAIEDIRDILGSTSMRKTGQLSMSGGGGQKVPVNEPPSWYKKLVDRKKG